MEGQYVVLDRHLVEEDGENTERESAGVTNDDNMREAPSHALSLLQFHIRTPSSFLLRTQYQG